MEMNSKDFNELLNTIVNAGFQVCLVPDASGFGYEIYTGAKSNITVFKSETDLCAYAKRYSSGICADYEGFLYELKSCLCGRDYANSTFFEFLVKEGVMQRNKTTVVTYS